MTTARPRQSLLSLFDPLLDPSHDHRSLSPDSDKENALSLFPSQPRPPPIHVPKRRLVDVGDITIEEDDTDLGHFLDDDKLEDQLHQTAQDDENETLTFSDMAKAATPKWSASRRAQGATPPSQGSRTPLADIYSLDEATPLARKRPPRLPFTNPTSPLASAIQDHVPTLPRLSITPGSPTIPIIPTIFVPPPPADEPSALVPPRQDDDDLRLSVSSLNLAASTTSLITDTAIPAFTPSSSSHTSPSAPPNYSMQNGLRPPKPTRDANRHSIDLQASFQLHLGGSEPVFDLLNDKISFFNSQNGLDSFLGNLEDEYSFESDSPNAPVEGSLAPPRETPRASLDFDIAPSSPSLLVEPDISTQHPRLSLDSTAGSDTGSASPSSADTWLNTDSNPQTPSPTCDTFKHVDSTYSTPSPSSTFSGIRAPRAPVAALKIVKRAKVQAPSRPRASLAPRNDTSTSLSVRNPSPKRTVPSRPPVVAAEVVRPAARSSIKPISSLAPKAPTAVPSGPVRDGPRRILVTDTKTVGTRAGSTTSATAMGPRRILPSKADAPKQVVEPVIMKEASKAPGLRPPTKYATLGASSIPKPAARNNSSGIPGPSGGTLRRGLGGSRRVV